MEFPQPRHYTINDFHEWAQRQILVLQPKFQRRRVWAPKAKSYLIDSILRKFAVPPIYIREVLDPKRKKTVREVVDGQQRLSTILDYLDDQLVVMRSHNSEFGGKMYSELSDSSKRNILNYPLSVVILIGADDADVFFTFERLNSYTLPLNAQEKLNAKYQGRFKQFVFQLGQKHLEFWRRNKILANQAIARMGEAELSGELVVAMLAGIQDKKAALESFYEKYDDHFPRARRIESEFETCISTIEDLFEGNLSESEFRKKTLFYSLTLVIYDIRYGLAGGRPERKKLTSKTYDAVRRALKRVEELLIADEPQKPREAQFIQSAKLHTNDIGPRTARHKFLKRVLLGALG